MSDIALVRTTFPDAAAAEGLCRDIIEAGLAACVTIDAPARSVHRWQGVVTEAVEVTALFKTTIAGTADLIARLTEQHPYALPVIESWPVSVSRPAAEWVSAAIAPAGD